MGHPLRLVSFAAALGLACVGVGCVTIYDPQRALQRPVVVDATRLNFEGTKLFVRCLSNDQLDASEAENLCRRVATLLRIQGAEVDTEVLRGPHYTPSPMDVIPDLIIELDGKKIHDEQSAVLAVISEITLTTIPYVAEETFEAGITVRDGQGAVLASEHPQARFITYVGYTVWGVNWLLDLFVRKDDDKLTGDAANKLFSRDFYGLVSQLAFNARVRQRLMHSLDTPVPLPKKKA